MNSSLPSTLSALPLPRPAARVMRPQNLSAIQPNRLSGTRALMNRMVRERWDIRAERFDVDANAEGTVVYSIKTPTHEFSFIGFSRPPSRTARTGRIIGRAWDMMGTLNEGPASEADIASAREELPKLYSGRATPNALIWCRSNRSMRIFDQTLAALADGRQPEIGELAQVCYLMRNTGLDGNGTFGTRSFASLGSDHPLGGMLQAQLLTAYMMREYSCDLVEHLARLRSDRAVSLDPAIRRFLGVGNGSALGLIFFVHKHPRLISSWIEARETAIAAARGLALTPSDARFERLGELLRQAAHFRNEDRMVYEAFAPSASVAAELAAMAQRIDGYGDAHEFPLDALASEFEDAFGPEAYETFLSILIELVPDEADALYSKIAGTDEMVVDPAETAGSLRALVERDYGWALEADMADAEAYKYIWYKSETAEEPRRGARVEVPDARDLGLDLCGDVQALAVDLARSDDALSVARFLLGHPRHRATIARLQTLRDSAYAHPRANINGEDFIPINLVRLMNAGLHGIEKTRDFLNRNLRGVLYHGAPTPDDIRHGRADAWFYPKEPAR